jgi:hypothetical protein
VCSTLKKPISAPRCRGALRKVFRGKFVAALRAALPDGELRFPQKLKLLAYPKIFAVWLPPFGGPEYVLQYLGRYTHRVAISNHRLVSLVDGQVFGGPQQTEAHPFVPR